MEENSECYMGLFFVTACFAICALVLVNFFINPPVADTMIENIVGLTICS